MILECVSLGRPKVVATCRFVVDPKHSTSSCDQITNVAGDFPTVNAAFAGALVAMTAGCIGARTIVALHLGVTGICTLLRAR